MNSTTLKTIMHYWNEPLPQDEVTIDLPFDIETFCRDNDQRIAELEAEYERLLILATKWCDKDHHDWQEILKIGDKS